MEAWWCGQEPFGCPAWHAGSFWPFPGHLCACEARAEVKGAVRSIEISETPVGTGRKPLSQCTFDLFSVEFHLSAAAEVAEYLTGFASYLPLLNCTITHYSALSAYLGEWRARIQLSRCLTHHFSTSYVQKNPTRTQQKNPSPSAPS